MGSFRPDPNILHRGPKRAKHRIGLFERGMHLGGHREVFLIEMTQDADP